MSDYLIGAIALMLVIEGLLPFSFPRIWRDVFRKATEMNDGQIRMIGLGSMMTGLVILVVAH
jgi:uncharacterized protein